MEIDLDKLADLVTSGDGRGIAGLFLLAFVWASKRWTPDKYLATPTAKRIFTAAIAGFPAVALSLTTHASPKELLVTAAEAFGIATGLHHLLDSKAKAGGGSGGGGRVLSMTLDTTTGDPTGKGEQIVTDTTLEPIVEKPVDPGPPAAARLLFVALALMLAGCCTSDRCIAVTTSNLMHDGGMAAAESLRIGCEERYKKAPSVEAIAALDVSCLPAAAAYDDFVVLEARLVALLVAEADDAIGEALKLARTAALVLAEKIGAVHR